MRSDKEQLSVILEKKAKAEAAILKRKKAVGTALCLILAFAVVVVWVQIFAGKNGVDKEGANSLSNSDLVNDVTLGAPAEDGVLDKNEVAVDKNDMSASVSPDYNLEASTGDVADNNMSFVGEEDVVVGSTEDEISEDENGEGEDKSESSDPSSTKDESSATFPSVSDVPPLSESSIPPQSSSWYDESSYPFGDNTSLPTGQPPSSFDVYVHSLVADADYTRLKGQLVNYYGYSADSNLGMAMYLKLQNSADDAEHRVVLSLPEGSSKNDFKQKIVAVYGLEGLQHFGFSDWVKLTDNSYCILQPAKNIKKLAAIGITCSYVGKGLLELFDINVLKEDGTINPTGIQRFCNRYGDLFTLELNHRVTLKESYKIG